MKLYKKIGLLSISLLIALSLSTKVQADEDKECKDAEYTNYYFFHYIAERTEFTNLFAGETVADTTTKAHGTYYPNLPDNATITYNGKICLTNGDIIEEKECGNEVWAVKDFYTKIKEVAKNGKKSTFKSEKNEKEGYGYLNDKTSNYLVHSSWYKIDENGNIGDLVQTGQDYSSIETDKLIKGTILTDPTFEIGGGDDATYYRFRINRTYTKDMFEDTSVYFDYVWKGSSSSVQTILSPALYKISYIVEECTSKEPEKTKYTATIKYLYKDTKKEASEPYSEKELDDGYTKEVTSPKVENCTPDKEKVTVKIEGKNFEEIVYYTCKEEEVEETPDTGNILIFIAWTVGLGALGYSIYWFKKNKQEEV